MGPLVLLHVALLGTLVSAAMYASWNWYLARRDTALLLFAVQALLCALLTASFVALATTTDTVVASRALTTRLVVGLLAISATAAMIARLSGTRARWFVRGVFAAAVTTALIHLAVRSVQVAPLVLVRRSLPWGEVVTVPIRDAIPWYIAVGYLVVTAVNVFGIVAALRLARRDRVGGLFIALAACTGLLSTLTAFGTDLLRTMVPYFGSIPFTLWIVFVALQLSRENARLLVRRGESDRRLRAIFDQTLHFMGLLDRDGVILEANRTVLEAAGIHQSIIGMRFWEAPFWSHSRELQAQVQDAVRAAAAGQTVRFESAHPLPDGSTGHVDFSLKPVVDERGTVVLMIPEGRDITARKKTQEALDRLVDVVAPRTGQDFFQGMVDTLCQICEADYALASAVDPDNPTLLRTIAVSHRGQQVANFSYAMAGTPCETIIQRELCYYTDNVQAQFPDDALLRQFDVQSYMGIPTEPSTGGPTGLIAVMHRAPLAHPEQARAMLHVVSARAGAELERRRTDAALQESESRFRSLITGLEVGVVVQDADDRIMLCNPAAAGMLGLQLDELHGTTSREPALGLVREDGTPLPNDEVPSVIAARTRKAVRNSIVGVIHRETGARTWLQVSAAPALHADGSVQHVLVTIVDISDRKRAEDAARATSRRLSMAISATSDAVWEWNRRTGEMYLSPRWFEMLGLPPDLPQTVETWRSACHPDDLAEVLARIDHALRVQEPYEAEARMRRADGTWAWVLGRGRTVEWDASGEPLIMAGTNTDITSRKEAEARRRDLEAQLAQAQRMESMGRLAGGIAHDFNNILTIINGYSDLLLHSGASNDEARQMLEDIRNAGDRAASLTRQLLTFSRHQVVHPDTVDLNAIVVDTERMLRRLIGEHIRLQTSLDAEPLWVRADAGQIGQVIVNLAVNGRDAMPQGGDLRVETTRLSLDEIAAAALSPEARPGTYAVLAVLDTGTGIAPELQSLVFEPFFTTKGPGKGTGLGLATVHGIAHQCAGFITVTSQPGCGSAFRLHLPLEAAIATEPPIEHRHGPTVQQAHNVLMVEDEPSVRAVVRTMLERMGLRVLVASDAIEAMRVADGATDPIHLLVTDLVMPGMNGRQLAQQLLSKRPTLRVVYMSGYTDDPVVRHIVGAEDATYVQKPFDADTLARKIRQALEAPPPATDVVH